MAGRGTQRFLRTRAGQLGALIVGLLVVLSTLGPILRNRDPLASDFDHAMTPSTGLPVGPCAEFPLGADRIFRDVLARILSGGRISLAIAVSATLLATTVGTAVGVAAGYLEGRRSVLPWPAVVGLFGAAAGASTRHGLVGAASLVAGVGASFWLRRGGPHVSVDGLLMRLVDVLLAFPFLVLVMAVGAALGRTSAITRFVVLGLSGWLGTARLVRAKTMQVRDLEFVMASRALGQPTLAIVWRHILPNVWGTLVVVATMQVATMIVADSVLSYLGLGITPPTPTWGRMLYEGQPYLTTMPWQVVAPGAAILLAVWGFNLLGEGLRDALDPRDP